MSIFPVYLLICNTWSDGEDYHEEDHNSYYDIKYFYIVNNSNYKCIFSWNANSNEQDGMISEVNSSQHLDELSLGEKEIGFINRINAIPLIECEIKRIAERSKYTNNFINEINLIKILKEFILIKP